MYIDTEYEETLVTDLGTKPTLLEPGMSEMVIVKIFRICEKSEFTDNKSVNLH
jgi:hypothetical protein